MIKYFKFTYNLTSCTITLNNITLGCFFTIGIGIPSFNKDSIIKRLNKIYSMSYNLVDIEVIYYEEITEDEYNTLDKIRDIKLPIDK